MSTTRRFFAASMIAVVCLSAFAKDKTESPLYEIKSGIMTMTNSSDVDFSSFMPAGPGMEEFNFDPSKVSTKIYFDDYGRKKATVTDNGTSVTRTITIDGYTYTINDTENTAVKSESFGAMPGMQTMNRTPNWLTLDKKTIKRYKIKEYGEEEMSGFTCQKYSYKTNVMNSIVTETWVWVYKGIEIRTQTNTEFANTAETVSELEITDVPESMFQLPEGCTVTERSFGNFMMMDGGFGGGGFGGGFGGGGFGGGF